MAGRSAIAARLIVAAFLLCAGRQAAQPALPIPPLTPS
jgi:hypothetical protein